MHRTQRKWRCVFVLINYMKQKYSLSFNEHDSSNEELREEDVWDATGFQMFVLRLVVLSVVAEHGVNVYCN